MAETFEFTRAKARSLKLARDRHQRRMALGVASLLILVAGVWFCWDSLSATAQTGIVVAALIAVAVSIMMRDLSNNE